MTNNRIPFDFTPTLLNWYEENARDLPWRNTQDPYVIWLSEIILQQTRVSQGMPYFLRFVELFPRVEDLAKADEQVVLKAWEGLGYYSRARNLHHTAKEIVRMGGKFPASFSELLKLKGVGNYTAAAIASFAFGEAVPVVDGNVYRFISRLFAIDTPVASNQAYKEFFALLKDYIPADRPGKFNQALMEFGSLQCIPQSPDCQHCVLNTRCEAFLRKKVNDFPVKASQVKVKEVHLHFIHLVGQDKVWLEQRVNPGIWKQLWHFPMFETEKPISIPELIQLAAERLGVPTEALTYQSEIHFTHLLTHRRIQAHFVKFQSTQTFTKIDIFEIDLKELEQYPMPQIMIKYLQFLKDE